MIRTKRAHHSPIFWFKQATSILTVNAQTSTTQSIVCAASTGLGISGMLTTFDQFRILKWNVVIKPFGSAVQPYQYEGAGEFAGVAQMDQCEIISAIDYDDSTAPSSYNGLKARGGVKTTWGNRTHRRTLTPCVQRQVFETNLTAAYNPSFKAWLPTNDATTPHFGIKFGVENLGDLSQKFRVQGSMLIQFKYRKNPAAADDLPVSIDTRAWTGDEHQTDDPMPNMYNPLEWQEVP